MSVKKFFAEQDYRRVAAMFAIWLVLGVLIDFLIRGRQINLPNFIALSISGILFTLCMSLFGMCRKNKQQ